MQLFRIYQEEINLLRQIFTRGELCMLIDILNGTYLDPHTLPSAIKASAEDSFSLYPGQYEEKWDIEKQGILEKLRRLNAFQAACLAIWANDFWYGSEKGAGTLDLDRYIKESPGIIQRLAAIEDHLKKAIELMEQSKGAFKSQIVADARAAIVVARGILEELL